MATAGVQAEGVRKLALSDIPKLARESGAARVFGLQRQFPTHHTLYQADARDLSMLPSESVHLTVTSPPYWTLKKYEPRAGQLGLTRDYSEFLDELDKVWHEVFRTLVPGGRLVCVVGDVCLSRRTFGRHVVIPLHADIAVRCRKIGFDYLAPIFWYKIANAKFEANTSSSILGKPYEPNSVVKNDVEFLVMLRKPDGYRQPTDEQRRLSLIPREYYGKWFRQIWDDVPGASTRDHPAPFPEELAARLVRMFSFVGDTVLDPFAGSGTTMIAAGKAGRNSIGVEVEPAYVTQAERRLRKELASLVTRRSLKITRPT